MTTTNTRISAQIYNQMHRSSFGRINDGSYEILAAVARGNKTIDISCGDGFIGQLSPQTVGVDFAYNALKKAQKNGSQRLVQADAHFLPFKNNAFDVAICSGSLEHFEDPGQAIQEMVRIARIQVLIVHKPILPFFSPLYRLLKNQPIEHPITQVQLNRFLRMANTHVVYQGIWTLPVNYGRPIRLLPQLPFPSCFFTISIKQDQSI